MGIKVAQNAVNVHKAEVGEIDTSAPFRSVKAAVSLFGKGALSAPKPSVQKAKPILTESTLARETELQVAQGELRKYEEQLNDLNTTRAEGLVDIVSAKKIIADLKRKLDTAKESKGTIAKGTEIAKDQAKQLREVSSSDCSAQEAAWKHELEDSREQYAIAITELDAAKQELRRIRMDFEISMEAKVSAFQQEADAKQSTDSNTEKATRLSKEIAAAHESIRLVKLALAQVQEEESKIFSEKNASKQFFRQKLQETEKKLSPMKKEFDPRLQHDLQAKLTEAAAEIGAIQKEMEQAKDSDEESVTTVTKELDGAKEVLQKVAEEEISLRHLAESLKQELEAIKKEHAEMKEKYSQTEAIAGDLHIKLHNCKMELEAATTTMQSKAREKHDELTSTLKQLNSESEEARKEAGASQREVDELTSEAKAARTSLNETEQKLQVALEDAEEAKVAEVKALNQFKALSDKVNQVRQLNAEPGTNITISKEEYITLSQKVEECKKLAEMKVSAAKAQVEAVRASEDAAIKKLEAARKKMEDIEMATEEALKTAETAEAAKKMVEGELRRWREKEQNKAADTGSHVLAESSPLKTKERNGKDGNQAAINRSSSAKKKLMPSFSRLLKTKKGQVDSEYASYLPGEKQV